MQSIHPRTYSLAAMTVMVCAIYFATGFGGMDAVNFLQPSIPLPGIDIFKASHERPHDVLRFMAVDMLFIFGYVVVFLGLHSVVRSTAPLFAALALGSGIAAGVFDLIENSYFIAYAMQALAGQVLTTADVPVIYIVCSLKWFGAFFAYLLFGLAWPRATRIDSILSSMMLLFPLVGALTIAMPSLLMLRPAPLVFVKGMAIIYFWHRDTPVTP